MAVTNKRALEAMTRARTQLFIKEAFFASLSLQLKFKEVTDPAMINAIWGSKEAATMAVDGKNLYYYPDWVLSLHETEVIGVDVHEVLHCALKHIVRRGNRDPLLFNVATDFYINLIVIDAGFKLPGQPMALKDLGQGNPSNNKKGYLYDLQFRGDSSEEIYNKLLKWLKKQPKGALGNNKGIGVVLDATKAGDASDEAKEEARAIEADWDTNVRQAVSVAKGKNAGTIPGCIARLVEELEKPVVYWPDQVRDFVSDSCVKDYSWSRLSRRSQGGMLFPGYVADSLHKVVWVMDCSGSINESMMQRMGSEGQGALDAGICDEMLVVYTDTSVQKVDEFLRGDVIKIQTPGGGGTDFKEVMEWIAENAADANAVIFLTDMFTCSFGEDPGVPVLWASITPPHTLTNNCQPPFGRVLHVPMEG